MRCMCRLGSWSRRVSARDAPHMAARLRPPQGRVGQRARAPRAPRRAGGVSARHHRHCLRRHHRLRAARSVRSSAAHKSLQRIAPMARRGVLRLLRSRGSQCGGERLQRFQCPLHPSKLFRPLLLWLRQPPTLPTSALRPLVFRNVTRPRACVIFAHQPATRAVVAPSSRPPLPCVEPTTQFTRKRRVAVRNDWHGTQTVLTAG